MKALEIFIGLFFVYLVLSTLVTSVSELISVIRHTKARVLRETVKRLLFNDEMLESKFFSDPEVVSLIDPKRIRKTKGFCGIIRKWIRGFSWTRKWIRDNSEFVAPSYLDSEVFARVLLRTIRDNQSSFHSYAAFQADLNTWKAENLDQRNKLARVLSQNIEKAVDIRRSNPQMTETESLIAAIADWYDKGMERSRGIYKRIVKKYVFWSALCITLFLNADTIRIVNALASDPASLSHSVGAAIDRLEAYQSPDQEGVENDTRVDGAQDAVRQLENTAFELENVGIPLGWDDYEYSKLIATNGFWNYFFAWLMKLVGLGGTVIAASLGAPFWYDILNKLARIRGSIKASPESGASTQPSEQKAAEGVSEAEVALAQPKRFSDAFSEGIEEFDINVAYWTACCAHIAYLDYDHIKQAVAALGVPEDVRTLGNQERGTQGFIVSTPEATIISFRGTEPKKLEDVFTDLKFLLEDWSSDGNSLFRVHNGFKAAYLSVRDELHKHLKELPKDRLLWLTGHSLGAALATLCAADLTAKKIPISGLYTFGSPRAGNRDFVEFLKIETRERVYRFVNEDDPVTEVPPELFDDYGHVGKIRYLDRFNRLKSDLAVWNRVLRKTAFWVDETLKREEIVENLKEELGKRGRFHRMTEYIHKIAMHSGHDVREVEELITKTTSKS